MSAHESQDDRPLDDEEGPGTNGDLVSWLYVIGGIPMMAAFFVVLFSLVRACDARNIMIHG